MQLHTDAVKALTFP